MFSRKLAGFIYLSRCQHCHCCRRLSSRSSDGDRSIDNSILVIVVNDTNFFLDVMTTIFCVDDCIVVTDTVAVFVIGRRHAANPR